MAKQIAFRISEERSALFEAEAGEGGSVGKRIMFLAEFLVGLDPAVWRVLDGLADSAKLSSTRIVEGLVVRWAAETDAIGPQPLIEFAAYGTKRVSFKERYDILRKEREKEIAEANENAIERHVLQLALQLILQEERKFVRKFAEAEGVSKKKLDSMLREVEERFSVDQYRPAWAAKEAESAPSSESMNAAMEIVAERRKALEEARRLVEGDDPPAK